MKSKLPAGVFFRSDRGVWCYLERQGGRRKLHTLGTDLADALKEHQKLIEGGAREKVRVDRAFARWLKEYVHVHRGEKGRAKAEQRGNDYFLSFMGFTLVDRVKPGDLRAYRKWLEAKKSKRKKLLSAQTVAHLLADARAFFRWCEDDGLIDRAPIPRKLLPKIQEQPPDRLTESECTALTSLKEPYGFVCRFGLATGLRWSEMYRAQSKDISGGMLVVHHTKSRKVRRVPLSAAILDELKDKVGRLVAVPDAPTSFSRICRRLSGVERFHAHQLRHTFACSWLERGGSLPALQQILGHSSIVTTQRYGRLSDEHVRAESQRISGADDADRTA